MVANLVEAASRVRQHGVNLAGVGSQVIAGNCRTTIAARDIVEQPFELVNVMFDGLPEVRIGSVLAADLLKCPLPLSGVETLGECATLAAFVAFPQVSRRV